LIIADAALQHTANKNTNKVKAKKRFFLYRKNTQKERVKRDHETQRAMKDT